MIHIFNKIYKTNPRNEREFEDIINDIIKDIDEKVTWKEYALWAFGEDATTCCVCEDIPEHYIECHTCEKSICNDCFENDLLRGDSFYMIITTNIKGQLGAYYCNHCYTKQFIKS